MATFLYCRISTDDKGQTIDNQIHLATTQRTDITIIMTDEGISGTKAFDKRPAFSRILKLAKPGDTIIATALDRITRDTMAGLALDAELTKRGVHMILLRERLETTTSSGRAMFINFLNFAEYERNLISERTKQALQRLKDNGKKLGKPVSEASQKASQMISEGFGLDDVTSNTGISRAMFYKLKKSMQVY